jgi:xanthine/uracil/vitamin C permease (AzgA family)
MLPISIQNDSVERNNFSDLLHGFFIDFKSYIINYFKITERGSSLQQEIRAGLTTFLTMCYILLVNPQILSKTGLPAEQIVLSTAVSAGG